MYGFITAGSTDSEDSANSGCWSKVKHICGIIVKKIKLKVPKIWRDIFNEQTFDDWRLTLMYRKLFWRVIFVDFTAVASLAPNSNHLSMWVTVIFLEIHIIWRCFSFFPSLRLIYWFTPKMAENEIFLNFECLVQYITSYSR